MFENISILLSFHWWCVYLN